MDCNTEANKLEPAGVCDHHVCASASPCLGGSQRVGELAGDRVSKRERERERERRATQRGRRRQRESEALQSREQKRGKHAGETECEEESKGARRSGAGWGRVCALLLEAELEMVNSGKGNVKGRMPGED
eukprot:2223939-Rhodomonas_salina.1